MFKSLTGLALLGALFLVGCDSVTPVDSPAPATVASATGAKALGCNPSTASIGGPSDLFYDTSASYTATMGRGCSIDGVVWTVTSGDATLASSSSNPTTATSGDDSFTLQARILYNTDNFAFVTKSVTVGPVTVDVDVYNHSFGLNVGWGALPVSPTYCTITRAVKNVATGQTTTSTWPVSSNPYFDNGYVLASGGPFLLSYTFKAYDGPSTDRRLIGSGGDGGKGDTSY